MRPLNSSIQVSDTIINAAFLAGTDITGAARQYNGGLQNYPRFHEDWRPATLTYWGSLVSLDLPRYVDGPWTQQVYQPPRRNWDYDRNFNNPANLPPSRPASLARSKSSSFGSLNK